MLAVDFAGWILWAAVWTLVISVVLTVLRALRSLASSLERTEAAIERIANRELKP